MTRVHWHCCVFLAWTVVASGVASCACEAADDVATTTAKTEEAPALRPITLTDIAPQAVEVAGFLRTVNSSINTDAQTRVIDDMLSEVRRRSNADLAGLGDTGKDTQHVTMLQAQELRWQRRQKRLAGWLEILTGETKRLEETLKRLTNLERSWQLTASAAKNSNAPQEILDQVDQTIAAVGTARASLEPKRASMLELQMNVAHEESRCGEVLAMMANAETLAMGSVLWRENPSLWNAELWLQSRPAMPQHAHRVISAFRDDIHDYVHDPTAGMFGHVVLLAVLTALFVTTRHRVRRWTAAHMEVPASTMVFDRPFAAALAGAMLVATSPVSSIPTELKGVFQVLAVAAMIRVTLPLVPRSLAGALYGLGCLFTVDTIRQSFVGTSLTEQLILVGESVGGIVLVIWTRMADHLGCLTWRQRKIAELPAFRSDGRHGRNTSRRRRPGRHLRLSTTVEADHTRSARPQHAGVWFLCDVQAGQRGRWGAVASPPHRIAADGAAPSRTRRTPRLPCAGLAGGDCLAGSLTGVPRFPEAAPRRWSCSAQRSTRARLDWRVLGRSPGLRVGDSAGSLYFPLHSLRARRGRASAMQTAPGLSYALSALLHYALLSLGFLLGLGFLGVDLTKITVLVSAFGVGIGFGLQSIVNNFASGLILLVERPINSQDAVEIGGLSGTVKHIGIRATIVRTADGADTIVPNSQFVSEKVVNWTLTDRRRRIRLTVGLNYGSPPEKAIRVLVSVAAHIQVCFRIRSAGITRQLR